jgi:hypothetical protein
MLHYRGCAKTRTEKGLDILLFIFGAAACIFCTVQTARLLVSDGCLVRKWLRVAVDRAECAAKAWQVPGALRALVKDEGKHELAQHLRIAHLHKHAITIE